MFSVILNRFLKKQNKGMPKIDLDRKTTKVLNYVKRNKSLNVPFPFHFD